MSHFRRMFLRGKRRRLHVLQCLLAGTYRDTESTARPLLTLRIQFPSPLPAADCFRCARFGFVFHPSNRLNRYRIGLAHLQLSLLGPF